MDASALKLQNEQLWLLVEKQRCVIFQLRSDVQRLQSIAPLQVKDSVSSAPLPKQEALPNMIVQVESSVSTPPDSAASTGLPRTLATTPSASRMTPSRPISIAPRAHRKQSPSRDGQLVTPSASPPQTTTATPSTAKAPTAKNISPVSPASSVSFSSASSPTGKAGAQANLGQTVAGTMSGLFGQDGGISRLFKKASSQNPLARTRQTRSAKSAPGLSLTTSPSGTPRTSQPVFGVNLERALSVSSIDGIPAVVYRCIEYLNSQKAELEEGIYRLSGSSAMIRSLRERFNQFGDINIGQESQFGDYIDVHAIAGLLKLFFRELSESLLPETLHADLMLLQDIPSGENRTAYLSALIEKLPAIHVTVLRALMLHLIGVVANSAVNKMTIRNLGIVFVPTLGIPSSVFSLMLTEYEAVFISKRPASADAHAPRTNSLKRSDPTDTVSVRSNSLKRNHGSDVTPLDFEPSSSLPEDSNESLTAIATEPMARSRRSMSGPKARRNRRRTMVLESGQGNTLSMPLTSPVPPVPVLPNMTPETEPLPAHLPKNGPSSSPSVANSTETINNSSNESKVADDALVIQGGSSRSSPTLSPTSTTVAAAIPPALPVLTENKIFGAKFQGLTFPASPPQKPPTVQVEPGVVMVNVADPESKGAEALQLINYPKSPQTGLPPPFSAIKLVNSISFSPTLHDFQEDVEARGLGTDLELPGPDHPKRLEALPRH